MSYLILAIICLELQLPKWMFWLSVICFVIKFASVLDRSVYITSDDEWEE